MPDLTRAECTPAVRRRRDGWVVAAVMLAVAVQAGLSLWGILSGPDLPRGWVVALDVVVGIASCLIVPGLAWMPVTTAVVAAALVVGSTTAIPVSTIATVRVARNRPPGTAVLVAGLGVLGHALRAWWRAGEDADLGWWVVVVVVIQMALYGWGAQLRAKDQQIAVLRDRAELVESTQRQRIAEARHAERTRIAREMHDVLAHRLSMVATFAGALEYRDDADPVQRRRAAGIIRANAHQALEDLREVIWVLRDETDPDADPADARRPQPGATDLAGLVAESRAAGVGVTLHGTVDDDIPATLGRTIHRVVQEGLTNARKHASGAPVQVTVDGDDDGWQVEVSNPRTGGDLDGSADLPPGAGAGLIGLTERVKLAGGTISYGDVGERFVLTVRLPSRSGIADAAAHH